MAKTRTFIAVEAAGEVEGLALAAIEDLSRSASHVRWVAPGNLHWTLQFLGDIDDVDLHEVCQRVRRAARKHEDFVLQARGVGAFPSHDRPRTLWIGAGEGSEELVALQADIELELREMGFPGEARRYVPHLTLGRVGRGSHDGPALAQRIEALRDYACGVMPVDEVIVFGSTLEREGPTYHVLARAPLE
jgi:2'-5' RNA ligase